MVDFAEIADRIMRERAARKDYIRRRTTLDQGCRMAMEAVEALNKHQMDLARKHREEEKPVNTRPTATEVTLLAKNRTYLFFFRSGEEALVEGVCSWVEALTKLARHFGISPLDVLDKMKPSPDGWEEVKHGQDL